MQSEFRFTRYGCRSPYDVTVCLAAAPSLSFSISFAPDIRAEQPGPAAVALGIRSAFDTVGGAPELAVTVLEIEDHAGATGDLGHKICGEAAMFHLLGLPERAPFPGYVLGEA